MYTYHACMLIYGFKLLTVNHLRHKLILGLHHSVHIQELLPVMGTTILHVGWNFEHEKPLFIYLCACMYVARHACKRSLVYKLTDNT